MLQVKRRCKFCKPSGLLATFVSPQNSRNVTPAGACKAPQPLRISIYKPLLWTLECLSEVALCNPHFGDMAFSLIEVCCVLSLWRRFHEVCDVTVREIVDAFEGDAGSLWFNININGFLANRNFLITFVKSIADYVATRSSPITQMTKLKEQKMLLHKKEGGALSEAQMENVFRAQSSRATMLASCLRLACCDLGQPCDLVAYSRMISVV